MADEAAGERETASGAKEADLTAAIDREIAAVWKRDSITPAQPSGDAEFLRRVYLDTVGMPPSYDEAVEFLDSKDTGKRSALIDKLVADPRFGRHMANNWAVLLTPRAAQVLSGGTYFADWLARRITEGVSFDQVIREIITARGEMLDNPAVVPWFRDGEGERITDMMGKLTKSLMGVQIQCAECHDHPYDDDIPQSAFQGMTAFLTPTRAVVDNRSQPATATVSEDLTAVKRIFDAIKQYDKLRKDQQAQVDFYRPYVNPTTLDGTKAPTENPAVWRDRLAAWWLGKDNVQTRRYVANRLWFMAFGTAIVSPVDDFNPLNEASHPELLDALAGDLLAGEWDIRRVYRAILKSRTWQLSSENPPAKAEKWHFAAYPVRALAPEQFLTTLIGLMDPAKSKQLVDTALSGSFTAAKTEYQRRAAEQEKAGGKYYKFDIERLERFEKQFTAIDGRWWLTRYAAGRYVSLSSDDENTSADGFTLSIDQALAVMNGDFTNSLAGSGANTLLDRVLKRHKDPGERFDALYLTILSRKPTAAERQRWRAMIKDEKSPMPMVEDLIYALLMTTEFGTNH
ncbi:MAG: DUF1549 domain-containing protein [Planctomycetes bacterium]|nr:DUF1549 domain-containing protein [Planctomycetota bacterium]